MLKKLNLINNNYLFSLIGFFVSVLPLSFLLGSLIINLNTLFIVLLFLIHSIKEKDFLFIKDKFFILITLLWLTFIVNLYFSSNFENSITRSFGFFRFIILVIAIKLFFDYANEKQKKILLLAWLFVFCVVSIDLIYEFIFGVNTLGFKSYMPGRLASFLNEELKIGQLYSAFFLICAVTIFKNTKNVYYLYFFIIFSILISLFIGERSNFIRVFMMSACFLFFFENKNYFKKLILVILIFLLTSLIIGLSKEYQKRFYGQFIKPIIKMQSVEKIINNTVYGANFDRAIKIYQSNKLFGVGIKNFRIESGNPKYKNSALKFNDQAATTHPHQIHLEILSETGLFGYLFFIIFIVYTIFLTLKNYQKEKNLYVLAGLLYFIFSLMPLIPSGSFFTTFGATLFWINYSFLTLEKN